MKTKIPRFLLLGFFLAFAGPLPAQWTGALIGTTNDADHSYTRTANPPWTSGIPEMTWDSTLDGATTLYFGANLTTAGTWNLNPAGNFALTLQGGGLVAPDGTAIAAANRTVTLGGNVSVDHTGGSNRQVFLGNTSANNQLALDLDGVQRTFTVASGSTLSLRNAMLNAGSGLIKEGGGTLRLEGNSQSNLGGTVRIDAGVLDVTTLGNDGLGTATFQLNGGKFHLRSNATDVNYGNNFTVTASSTFEYDSTASGNSNPRRFVFGGIDIQGAHTLNFDNNNGGWYHFNGPIQLGGAATFSSNNAEGQSRPVFVGAVNDNGLGFTKTGTGLIDLANSANDITGPLLVSQGQILLRNAGAIGTPSSITLGSGATTGFIGFLANEQTFSRAVTLGTANSGFSAGGVQAGTNFVLPGTSVATLTGVIHQAGLALGLAGGPVGGVLRLNTGNRTAETGGTLVSGTVHASQMNNFSGGNLNITTGGALVIDPTGATGPTWAQFVAARPTWGTSDGEVQLTGGFFAAKNGTVTINLNDITGAPVDFFDANYTLGSLGRDSSGQIYTDGSIRIAQDTTLTAVRNFTISTTGPGRLGDPTGLPVMEYTGNLSGAGGLQVLGTNGTTSGGILRLGGTLSTTGNVYAQTNSSGFNTGPGGVAARTGSFLEFGSPASLPSGAPADTVAYIAGLGSNNGAAMEQGILFAASATDYVLNRTPTVTAAAYKVIIGGNAGGQWRTASFGASGTSTLAADVLLLGDSGTSNASYGLIAREGAFTLGTVAQSTRFISVTSVGTGNNGLTGAANVVTDAASGVKTLIKTGVGTAILSHVEYTNVAGTPVTPGTFFAWQIGRNSGNTPTSPYFDGAVRETGNSSANSLAGFNIFLSGGVLESSDAAIGGPFTRGLGTGSTQVRWGTGGGGFSAGGGDLTVNVGGAAASFTWNASNFVPNNAPLIFGSQTADSVVTLVNTINFGNAVREIRVYDNPDSAGDRAVISGQLTGTGSSGFLKTGDGRLDLSANNNYAGATTVAEGTLRIQGTHTSTQATTVNAGAVLGGSGRIGGAILGEGLVSPGSSPGIFTAVSVTGSEGTDFAFEFGQAGAPTWSAATASGNDVLRLTGGAPFVNALDANNVVNLYFAEYGTYQGGFYTDPNSDFSAQVANATFNFFLEAPGGSVGFEGKTYHPFSPLALSMSSYSVVQVASADFADGTVTNGWTMEFVAIPEPGTLALLALGLGCAVLLGRRRRA